MRGEIVPTMIAGQTYWKNAFMPAGVCTVITPMNFIYGIPGIQIAACYLSGSPLIFKGHPFSAITSTTLVKMLVAAGADPRAVYKLEGFGGDIAPLVADPRVAVVSVTGSAETAKAIQAKRGVRPVRFEGGGCNWSWVDDGFTDDELRKIAVRLAYSKLGLGSHKCTTLHGIAGARRHARSPRADGRGRDEDLEVGRSALRGARRDEDCEPAHGAQGETVSSIQERARGRRREGAPGGTRHRRRLRRSRRMAAPVLIGRVTPETRVAVDWDGTDREIALATTEFFMPILVTMEVPGIEAFVRFCLEETPRSRRRACGAATTRSSRSRGRRSAACSRRTTAPTARSSGRSSAPAASARAATRGWATPRPRSPCSAGGQKGRHFVL